MSLHQICASTVAYIFMHDAEQQRSNEVLVKTTSGVFCDKAALKSLIPRCPIDSQIINLVVARCNWVISMAKCKSVWYFPTEFAHYVLDGHYSVDYVRKIYHDKFMKTSTVSKIIFC
ncbi:hypothetical protein P8452_60757 [Trifolium repens]|nr:hypothetical protein P8452_60757 [Trifolium repens]